MLDLAPFLRYLRHVHFNRIMPDSNPLADISGGGSVFEEQPIPFYSVSQLDRLAPSLCEPMILHARLATVVGRAVAVPARNSCGVWPDRHFCGVYPGERHDCWVA